MGDVRVDGLPVRFSKTDWKIERGGPCVGEHTEEVLREAGVPEESIAKLSS